MNLLLLSVLVFTGYSAAEKLRFDNYTLYRFTPKDERQLNILKNMEQSGRTGYDFWTSPRSVGSSVDVLVPPHRKKDLISMAKILGMDSEVLMENIQEQIDEEASSLKLGAFDWSSYRSLEEINNWLRTLAKHHPGVVTLLKVGSTYENRDILGVRVSFSSKNEHNAVWIDSNIHAREWISGAVNTFILNELLTNKHISTRKVAESHDWYIFPVLNPDGYEYTFTDNRLWRKTRTPNAFGCFGVDPNRNWDYKWKQGGASNYSCDDTYAGPKPFSEPSTSSLSKYISTIASKLKVYISFHSYSQLIVLPYGHTREHLDNYNVTYPVGVKAAESLAERYGTKYIVGNIPELLYTATGSSMDWVKGKHHIPFAFTYELRDTGKNGFLLPTKEIIPTALETLDSVLTIIEEADKIISST